MGRPYSEDLRERIVEAVEGGSSRRGAAEVFGVSPSCAVKLHRRWRETGSVSPARLGAPKRCKLDPETEWLLALVKAEADITLGEIRAALSATVPARTVDGLRRRTRVLQGRCQGFNCHGAVVAQLAAHTGEEAGRLMGMGEVVSG